MANLQNIISLDELLRMDPFALKKEQKQELFLAYLKDLSKFHLEHCEAYNRILEGISFDLDKVNSVEDLPFLPVSLFKKLSLKSIADNEVFKKITSSGTSGQQVSQIFLDRKDVLNQQKALVNIVSSLFEKKRLPMLVIDSESVVKDRLKFSARTAGIQGFSIFARDRVFALDENMQLQVDKVQDFLSKHQNEVILVFGFTFMVWQHFYQALRKLELKLDFPQGSVLIHGGGWKKLQQEAVSPTVFKDSLKERTNLSLVVDYYGMAEQTGSIFIECECGHLHCSNLSQVIIRNPQDFSPCKVGEKGLIEVISLLPHAYPGHLLLTEDEGYVLGEDACPCGRLGRYFKVIGRAANTEIRGCSDTYARNFN